MLKGFTRPVRRLTALLQARGDVHADVETALESVYDRGVLATRFAVPFEFTQILWTPD